MATRCSRARALAVAALLLTLAIGPARALTTAGGLVGTVRAPEPLGDLLEGDWAAEASEGVAALAEGDQALDRGELRAALQAYQRGAEQLEQAKRVPRVLRVRLLDNLGLLAFRLGLPAETLDYVQAALREVGGLTPPRPRWRSRIRRLLASVQLARGRVRQALKPAQDAWRDAREHLGEDDPDTALAALTLGAVQLTGGLVDPAKAAIQKGIQVLEASGDASQRALALMLPLKAALHLATEEVEAAQETLRRAMELQLRVLGREDPLRVGTMVVLAQVHFVLDRPSRALATLEQALRRSLEAYGEVHRQNSELLEAMAQAENQRRRYREAYGHIQRSLAIRRRLYGLDAPETGVARMGLAELEYYAGRFSRAYQEMTEAIRLVQTAYGSDHPVLALAWILVARALAGQGNYAKARIFLDRAEKSLRHRMRLDSPFLMLVRIWRAGVELEMGDEAAALASLDKVRRAAGEEPKLARQRGMEACLRGLALVRSGKAREGEAEVALGVSLLEEGIDENRHRLIPAWKARALAAIERGDMAAARRWHQELRGAYGEGITAPEKVELDRIEALAALQRGAGEAARRVTARLKERVEKTYGPEHPRMAEVRRLQARAREGAGG